MAGSQAGLSETFVKAEREGRRHTRPQRRNKALLCALGSRERRLQALDDRETGKAKCHRPGRTPFPPAGKRHAHASGSLPSEKAGGRQQLWYTCTCHKSRKGFGKKGTTRYGLRCGDTQLQTEGSREKVRHLCQEDTSWPERPPAQRPSLICLEEGQRNQLLRAPTTMTTHPQKYCQ